MTAIVHIPNRQDFQKKHDEKYEFKRDIKIGLESPNKKIQSKYFYDDNGCKLFNKITKHPDYYLTQCEIEILNFHKKRFSKILGAKPFNLIEFGPGEGLKSKIIIEQFLLDAMNFKYLPIDISTNYLNSSLKYFSKKVEMIPIQSDYLSGLEWLNNNSDARNVVLFLGSSIGNFTIAEIQGFLRSLWALLKDDDFLFIGFDLKKDVEILLRAYSDSEGITRDFNLNLLERINRELNANFNTKKFRHYATYNIQLCAMESYLLSLESQIVNIHSLEQSFAFEENEPMHVEHSQKFTLNQIEQLASSTGFKLVQNFMDSQQYFVDSLWRKKEIKS